MPWHSNSRQYRRVHLHWPKWNHFQKLRKNPFAPEGLDFGFLGILHFMNVQTAFGMGAWLGEATSCLHDPQPSGTLMFPIVIIFWGSLSLLLTFAPQWRLWFVSAFENRDVLVLVHGEASPLNYPEPVASAAHHRFTLASLTSSPPLPWSTDSLLSPDRQRGPIWVVMGMSQGVHTQYEIRDKVWAVSGDSEEGWYNQQALSSLLWEAERAWGILQNQTIPGRAILGFSTLTVWFSIHIYLGFPPHSTWWLEQPCK